ncbi:uncharacterized protein LOC131431002 [Malaya genurostris]|uniref:uncharacterized protein LOC131431002 n=1 Tax=Malaya genurostris TaxID=325434 RepID=UPI0026F3BF4A|nr:uncharacterized protein LOC131431002 [Malaya genurostris]
MDPAQPEEKQHDLRLRATQTLQLIGLVESHRVLYDTSDKNYNRKKSKSAAWKEITASVLGIKPDDVTRLQSLQIQHKWKSLRTAYVRQRRLANPLAPYRYADLMSFLDPYLRREEAVVLEPSGFSAPFELDLSGDVSTDIGTTTIKDNCIDFFDPIEEELIYDVQMVSKQPLDDLPTPLSSSLSTNSESVESVTFAGPVSVNNSNNVDELEMFFSQIKRTIRKFSVRKTIELKMQIFNLVSQAELDELDATNK